MRAFDCLCALGPSKNRNEGKGKSTGHTKYIAAASVDVVSLAKPCAIRHVIFLLLLGDAPHLNLYTVGWPVAAHCYCCLSALISSRQRSVRSHTTGGLDMEGGGDEALVTRTPPDC
jgi:hypothetical protein